MNPFIYRYTISVTQQELTTSAVTDFIEILLPPGLRLGAAARAAADANKRELARIVQRTGASSPIARRLDKFDPANCLNATDEDRKSTRLNSSHSQISYAVFCLKKKKKK